jgi:hypothetical protein
MAPVDAAVLHSDGFILMASNNKGHVINNIFSASIYSLRRGLTDIRQGLAPKA